MSVTINLSNKTAYVLVGIFAIIAVTAIGFAYNSGEAPSTMGHSAEELEIKIGGDTYTLQEAITNNLIGGGAQLKTGSFTGDGQLDRVIDVGFRPDWVQIVDLDHQWDETWYKTKEMEGCFARIVSADVDYHDHAISLEDNGFKLCGSGDMLLNMNTNGIKYVWTAIKA